MTGHKHAEIAGGGFAGLAVAIALRQRGWTTTVHERASEVRSFGAGIGLWENGVRVLKCLGAWEHIAANSHQPPFYNDRTWEGEPMYTRPLPLPGGTRFFVATRQTLHEALLNQANNLGVEVRTNSEVIGGEPDGRLIFADGSERTGDLVVAADGVGSNVRESMNMSYDTGRYHIGITRVLVPFEPGELDREENKPVINFWGPDMKRRVIYTPCDPANLYMALAADVSDKTATRVPVVKEDWIRAFPPLETFLSRISSDTHRYDNYRYIKLTRWSKGKVAFIGDAAHAMPPTLGQGANSALMGAISLAEQVSRRNGVEEALQEWETTDRPIINKIQTTARGRIEGTTRWSYEEGQGWLQTDEFGQYVATGAQ